MSSARKRSAVAKANNEAEFQRQRAMRAEHHAAVMEQFARAAAIKADGLQARLDELMFEYCPDEMTPEQIDNYAKHQRPVDAETEAAIDAAMKENGNG